MGFIELILEKLYLMRYSFIPVFLVDSLVLLLARNYNPPVPLNYFKWHYSISWKPVVLIRLVIGTAIAVTLFDPPFDSFLFIIAVLAYHFEVAKHLVAFFKTKKKNKEEAQGLKKAS